MDEKNEENAMEEIKPKTTSVGSSIKSDQVDQLLSQAVNLNEALVLHEPTCPLCSSPDREEIEEFHKDKKDFKLTRQYYKDKTGDDISRGVIENHMKFHCDREVRELQKIEYIDKIKRYSGQNLTTLDRISICFSVLSERLMGVNSIVPAPDESIAQIEKLKSTETARIMTTLNNLLKLQAGILGEMKSSGELISIPTNDFIRIINDALANASTESERNLVKRIIDGFDSISKKAQ